LTGVVLGHFWLLSRCGRSIPCTGSPNTPPPSCFSPLKCVPLSLNAYIAAEIFLDDANRIIIETMTDHIIQPPVESTNQLGT